MPTAICKLASLSPYSQSRFVNEPRRKNEGWEDFERRVWPQRLHVDGATGRVCIPAMSFKNAVMEAAQYLGQKIEGEGNARWTKNFRAGVLVLSPLVLPLAVADVKGEWLLMNADGKHGGGKRVARCYPVIAQWSGSVRFEVLDDKITRAIFEKVLQYAGNLVGIGRWRPLQSGGSNGRFAVESVEWLEE